MTNVLSDDIEERRLWIDNVERRSDESVLDKFGVLDKWGKIISASVNGWDMMRFGMMDGEERAI